MITYREVIGGSRRANYDENVATRFTIGEDQRRVSLILLRVANDADTDTREAAQKGIQEGFVSPVSRPAPEAENPESSPRQRVPLGTRP